MRLRAFPTTALFLCASVATAGAIPRSGAPQVAQPAVPPGYQYAEPLAYPAGQQGPQQQIEDRAQCHTWSGQNDYGFDPRNPYATIPSPQQIQEMGREDDPVDGSAVVGAARGAAAGALIGWAAGNAGKGAAIGAATGAIFGRAGSRRQRQAQKQAEKQQAQAQLQAQDENFNRLVARYNQAFTLCMQARDYVTS